MLQSERYELRVGENRSSNAKDEVEDLFGAQVALLNKPRNDSLQ